MNKLLQLNLCYKGFINSRGAKFLLYNISHCYSDINEWETVIIDPFFFFYTAGNDCGTKHLDFCH